MATISKARRKANPMKTKNDRIRLGNLSMTQLVDLRDNKSSKPKIKRKVQNRINVLNSRVKSA